ncbi:16S rRNA (guanine(966)-N(2))-methyltransferase RsmD [Desulfohalovibrio reitneri]|uniref:16S rRNA (guanine(966)-N(2))-methyltransferase RsmD n=1 Tax=Desulfohalovibrio reitneri TaxID=1307759 RepID=UPI0004A71CDA|nr:16S rRNA (guanine(966)-N(2))-methyltransferase RsmD [Desulfohalovibrio reitneri]
MRITGGRFRGRRIHTGEGEGYRPATAKVREALFSMLSARGVDWSSCRVLDVFAGSGSLGLEAASRGAPFIRFVERDKRAAGLIRKSCKELGLQPGDWLMSQDEAARVLAKGPDLPYDVAFVDPPYGQNLLASALAQIVGKGWLRGGAWLVCEISADEDLGDLPEELGPPETDKRYGQTRILLWRTDQAA